MNKYLSHGLIAVISVLATIICLSVFRNDNALSGTWTVASYILADVPYNSDEFAEIIGEEFVESQGKITMKFSSDDIIEISTSFGGDIYGSYKLFGNNISIYDTSETHIPDLTIVNDTIELKMSDSNIILVFKKK